jgi:hypothetical protein
MQPLCPARTAVLTTALGLGLVLSGCAQPVTAPGAAPEATAPPVGAPTDGATLEPAAPAALSVEALGNATYPTEHAASGSVTLVDGAYQEEAAPGSAAQVQIMLDPGSVAYGDLNGDGVTDAAVVLIAQTGGSGTFHDLYAVLDEGGVPTPAASTLLGDRVKIQSVAIDAGAIQVEMLTQGPGDPMANPTQPITRRYRLEGDQLVEMDA